MVKINAAPHPVSRPPQRISIRPVKIRVDFHKARGKDCRLLAGHEGFVFRTAQAFLVMAFDGFADRIRNVRRDALDLLPPQSLDHGMRQPGLSFMNAGTTSSSERIAGEDGGTPSPALIGSACLGGDG